MDLLVKRILALAIDYALVTIPTVLIRQILFFIPFVKFNYINVFFLIFFIYNLVIKYRINSTIGKNIMKIKIEPNLNFKTYIIREFIKVFTLSTFYSILGLVSLGIMVFIDPEISIHDKVVKSRVCL